MTQKPAQIFARQQAAELNLIPAGEPQTGPDEFRAVIEARQSGVSIMDAIAHWKRTVGASGGRTVTDLIAARLEAAKSDGLSRVHAKALERNLERLRSQCGHLLAASVGSMDLAPLIYAGRTQSTQSHTRAIISSVFNHAIRCGWLQTNPAAQLRPQRKIQNHAPPAIFTVPDALRWLQCVRDKAPSCFAGWAIALFAGLRRSEIERLDWSEVKLARQHIEVTAAKAKTRNRRLVDIMPNLAAMLKPLAQKEGRLFPHSPKRAEAWAFLEYGGSPAKNAARHSFVSYHLALYGDVAKTEMQSGHDRKVLFRHYRELVTKKEAGKYFAIKLSPAKPA